MKQERCIQYEEFRALLNSKMAFIKHIRIKKILLHKIWLMQFFTSVPIYSHIGLS